MSEITVFRAYYSIQLMENRQIGDKLCSRSSGRMSCKSCHSENQRIFSGEVATQLAHVERNDRDPKRLCDQRILSHEVTGLLMEGHFAH